MDYNNRSNKSLLRFLIQIFFLKKKKNILLLLLRHTKISKSIPICFCCFFFLLLFPFSQKKMASRSSLTTRNAYLFLLPFPFFLREFAITALLIFNFFCSVRLRRVIMILYFAQVVPNKLWVIEGFSLHTPAILICSENISRDHRQKRNRIKQCRQAAISTV